MDGSSVPSRTAGADSILYTTRQQTHQLHGPEKRLPSYTSRGSGVGWPGARGARGLDLEPLWVSAAAGRCGSGLGMNTGPRLGTDARIRGRPIGSHLLVLGSCGSSAAGLTNEVLYNTRTPYTVGPTRSDTVGQGRALKGPQKRKFCCCRYVVGTPRWNGPRLEQSEQGIVVQTYRRIMQSARQSVSRSCPIFCWPSETRREKHTYAAATPFHF